jgi:crotonobetainyl-CoA:carnitine CoA-transferase CaiB-like acyl-CoA transferase
MERKSIFEGIKVASFAWAATGPLAVRMLAEHGATVVRIESHRRPTLSRFTQPYKDQKVGIDRSAHGAKLMTNNYGMSLDLSKPKGKEVAKRLIQWADIVTEAFAPGMMKRWGLDYEEAKRIKPDIIYFSTSMQGAYGPHTQFAAYGLQMTSLAGFSMLTGHPEREPILVYDSYTDWVGPWYLVIAMVGALDRKRKTAKGMYIEQSQYESAVTMLAPEILDYTVNRRVAKRMANRDPYGSPHGVYRCRGRDRWIAIAIFKEDEWTAFCDVIGNPPWTKDPKFASLNLRKENEDALDRLVEDWTMSHPAGKIMELMQARGVPAGVVQNAEDLFNDPQLKNREALVFLNHEVIGPHPYDNEPTIFSKTPPRLRKPGPCLGQDNEFVYKELLGYTDDEIADMLIEGVITTDADASDGVTAL